MPVTDSASAATKILAKTKIPHVLHSYDHDPSNHHFGDEGATKLGFDPSIVLKTLVIELAPSGTLAVAVVPVSRQVDLKAFASVMGAKKAAMATPAAAGCATGYIVGGISPLGQKKRLPICIDESVLGQPRVLVSGGRRGLSVELSPSDLVTVTGAVTAKIAR
ncbi:Cys-tRNA(Pro) deacylase [Cutibacterium sp. WCA-380-WT-3A]|uniref:Cys-tRNA(Pro)/Cys-tRNA(Cys) deacylase n=1 Tax=Cutibacterium porci TaxID=2605781 RepID=A0A7K0J3R0_9ACTN|nr:Cys-tRNA(Pro) deacylase [Cutibacterium porci]MSS44563.1 Cys-tRNA(Pro) deacylase [Cutibacterium porci]